MSKQRLILFIPVTIFLLLGILFWKGLSLNPNELPSVLINKPFPVFTLQVVPAVENPENLPEVTQLNLIGKVSLVNVWATWCVTCRAEHEYLNQLKAKGVVIYGVNYKDEKTAAQNWLRELHNPYVFSIFDQDGQLGMDLGVYGAPETFVLDKKGIIRFKHVGDVNEKVWKNVLKPLLETLEKE